MKKEPTEAEIKQAWEEGQRLETLADIYRLGVAAALQHPCDINACIESLKKSAEMDEKVWKCREVYDPQFNPAKRKERAPCRDSG